MKEIILKKIITIFIIFSTFLSVQLAYSSQPVKINILTDGRLFNREPVIVRCVIIKKVHGYTILDVFGNKHVSGYYIARGIVKKKKGKKFYCLTDGYSIEIMKKVRKETIK